MDIVVENKVKNILRVFVALCEKKNLNRILNSPLCTLRFSLGVLCGKEGRVNREVRKGLRKEIVQIRTPTSWRMPEVFSKVSIAISEAAIVIAIVIGKRINSITTTIAIATTNNT